MSGAEVGVYLQMRKKVVGLGDLKKQWNDYVKSWTTSKVGCRGPEKVVITGKDSKTILRPEREAPTRPAYDAIQLAWPTRCAKNAEQIDIAPSSQGLATKYTVDGVSYDGPALEPTAGAAGISMLKAAAGMDVNERRKPQSGPLKANAWGGRSISSSSPPGARQASTCACSSTPRAAMGCGWSRMGLPADTQAAVMETVKGRTGIVLVAAPKGQGMTSMLYAILRATMPYRASTSSSATRTWSLKGSPRTSSPATSPRRTKPSRSTGSPARSRTLSR